MKKEDIIIVGAVAVVGVAVIYLAWKQSQQAPPKKPPETAGAVGGLGGLNIARAAAARLRIQPGAATGAEKKQIQTAIMAASNYAGEMMAAIQAAETKTADEQKTAEIKAASKDALEAERMAAKAEAAAAVAPPEDKWAAEETAKVIRMVAEAQQAAALGLINA